MDNFAAIWQPEVDYDQISKNNDNPDFLSNQDEFPPHQHNDDENSESGPTRRTRSGRLYFCLGNDDEQKDLLFLPAKSTMTPNIHIMQQTRMMGLE